jgi:hypothetical protein
VAASLALAPVDLEELSDPAVRAIDAMQLLAESIPDGIRLQKLVDEETPIPRNEGFDKLVLLRTPVHTVEVGSTTLSVIGPSAKHLERLRAEWRAWLGRQRKPRPQTRPQARPQRAPSGAPDLGLGAVEFATALDAATASAQDLVASLAAAAEIIDATDPSAVTPPNRASIILLAEEDGRTCLLPGDANEEEILEGLRAAGHLADGPFWCDVLKVQHHGSEHNLSTRFASQVLAGNYVFSADGAHGNPNPSVVKTIVAARVADPRPFTLSFTCSETRTSKDRVKALRAAVREARTAQRRHPDAITVVVLGDRRDFLDIDV